MVDLWHPNMVLKRTKTVDTFILLSQAFRIALDTLSGLSSQAILLQNGVFFVYKNQRPATFILDSKKNLGNRADFILC